MGNYRPIKVKCWEKFLESLGCKFSRTAKGSHHIWKCPNCFQSIVFRGAEKEIPFSHISTNLVTMNIDKEVFLQWVEANC